MKGLYLGFTILRRQPNWDRQHSEKCHRSKAHQCSGFHRRLACSRCVRVTKPTRTWLLRFYTGIVRRYMGIISLAIIGSRDSDPEWSKNWNALKRRDVRLSQSAAAVSLSQVCSG